MSEAAAPSRFSGSFRIFVELTSALGGVSFFLSALTHEIAFRLHGLSFLAVASAEDVVLSAIELFLLTVVALPALAVPILIGNALYLGGQKMTPRTRRRLTWGAIAGFAFGVGVVLWFVSDRLHQGVGVLTKPIAIRDGIRCSNGKVLWSGSKSSIVECGAVRVVLNDAADRNYVAPAEMASDPLMRGWAWWTVKRRRELFGW